jgi:hypothetical protein
VEPTRIKEKRKAKEEFFINWYSGGWSPNWLHSVLRPPIGLLCQPRVIMMMENLMETEVFRENLPQCCFVHHKPHMPARA